MLITARISFFLITLQSFYVESIGISPFSILGAGVAIGLSLFPIFAQKSNSLDRRKGYFIGFSYLIFLAASVVAIIIYYDTLDLKRIIGFIVVLMMAFSAPSFFKRFNVFEIVTFTLFVHEVMFIIQFIAFFVLGFSIDYVGMIVGTSQKGSGGGFEHEVLGEFRRLGGLFNEPGTYSVFLAPMIALLSAQYRSSLLRTFVVNVGLLTLVLSFSTYGLIFALAILLVNAIRYRGKTIVAVITIGIPVFFYGLPYFYDRFVVRASAGLDTGVDFRSDFLQRVIAFIFSGPTQFLLGTGLLDVNIDKKIQIFAAVNDSSMLLSMVLGLGPVLTIGFFVYLCLQYLRISTYALLCCLIVFLSKASIFWPFVPFILVAFYYAKTSPNFAYKQIKDYG